MLAPLTLVASLAPQHGEAWKAPAAEEVRKNVRAAIAEAQRKQRIPAVLVAAVAGGKVLLGLAEGEVGRDRTADASTLFPLGDVSRAIANLTLHRMVAAKQLDLGRKVNDVLRPFVLADESDNASSATLLDVLRGQVKLPPYVNFLAPGAAAGWGAARAVRENAFVPSLEAIRFFQPVVARGRGILAYAILQHAAQTATGRPWHALVQRHVAGPLRLKSLVSDGRAGLPATAAVLYGKGLFGLRVSQKKVLSDVPAAYGAWANGADVGRLLLALLAEAGDGKTVADLKALVARSVVFSGFLVSDDPHPHLYLRTGGPGLIGGIALYPGFGRGWAVFGNYRDGNQQGMPGFVRHALEEQLLPAKEADDDPWNTAVGLGGGGAGGAFGRPLPQRFHGEWRAKLLLRGEEHALKMTVDGGRVVHLQCGEGPRRSVRFTHVRDQLMLDGTGLIPVRDDLSPACEFALVEREAGGRTVLRGNVAIQDPYCQMSFRVSFARLRIAKVRIDAAGGVWLDGAAVGLDALDRALGEVAAESGEVWYHREGGVQDPPDEVARTMKAVLDLVTKRRLPIKLSARADFADRIDGKGRGRRDRR